MSKFKALLVLTVLVIVAASSALADTEAIFCNNITESPVDTIKVEPFAGVPGDTVWMPISIRTDSTVSGFAALILWDDTYLTPVPDPNDPSFVLYELVGRLQDAQDQSEDDVFVAAFSQNPFDSGAIVASYNTGFMQTLTTMAPGEGVVFRLAFEVDASMSHGQLAAIRFHEVNEWWLDTAGYQHYADCRRTEFSLDFNGLATVVTYPTSLDGYFQADTAPAPIIETYYADPDTVPASNTFALNWSVQNADYVKTFGAGITEDSTETLDGLRIVQAPSTVGSYEYYILAGNSYATTEDTTILIVSTGGSSDPHAPVISANSAYSVDVGTTLNFNVTASDIDGDVITLSATSLPDNATFTSVSGVSPVSSSFSFTPTIAQAGSHTAAFRATDGALTTNFTVTIVVNEPEYDKLFSSSVYGSAVGGIPGKTGIIFPVNLITSQIVYGVQFDFIYDADNFEVTDVTVTTNTADYVIYEDIGQTPGTVRFVAFGMANEPIGSDGTEILYVELEIDADANPGLYPIYLTNAWESIDPDPNSPSLPLEADSGLVQVDAFGDVNLDTRINVADLVSVVGYIIGDYTLDARRYDIADVVADAQVDVFDLVAIVNMIYGIPVNPAPGQFEDRFATLKLDFNDMYSGSSDILTVRSEMPVDIAGMELDITYDPQAVELGVPVLSDDVVGMALTTRDDGHGHLKALVYFTNPFGGRDMINAGRPDLLEIPVKAKTDLMGGDASAIKIHKALLSTSNSMAVKVEGLDVPVPSGFVLHQNYPNPFNPSTTIEFSIDGSAGGANQVTLDVYNILGQNVKTLLDRIMPPGNHQVVWDGNDNSGTRVASGIYLYKLQVEQDSQTKKMLLLK